MLEKFKLSPRLSWPVFRIIGLLFSMGELISITFTSSSFFLQRFLNEEPKREDGFSSFRSFKLFSLLLLERPPRPPDLPIDLRNILTGLGKQLMAGKLVSGRQLYFTSSITSSSGSPIITFWSP